MDSHSRRLGNPVLVLGRKFWKKSPPDVVAFEGMVIRERKL